MTGAIATAVRPMQATRRQVDGFLTPRPAESPDPIGEGLMIQCNYFSTK